MRKLKRLTLGRAVCDGLKQGHPWVFRDKIGEPKNLKDGDWVKLLDPQDKMVGTGIYQAQGGVAVRVFRHGRGPFNVPWIKQVVDRALERRGEILAETNAYRVINGESDGLPGIVVDCYAGVGVLQTYAPGLDCLGRYVGGLVADRLKLNSLVWKAPSKRVGEREADNRLLRGRRPYVVRFEEGPLRLSADLYSGQKSGTYLDLRGLRRFLLGQNLRGQRVLNLFSYTGSIGLACAHAGAKEVVNVDQALPSLEFGQRYHAHPAMKWVEADIFEWMDHVAKEEYDLIIVDPPSMAGNKSQVAKALKTYHKLYSTLLPKIKSGGAIVCCCCTSRISRREFEEKVSFALRPMKRIANLAMEPDHEPGTVEADYLKIMVFQKSGSLVAGTRSAPKAASSKKRVAKSSAKGKPKSKTKAPQAKEKSVADKYWAAKKRKVSSSHKSSKAKRKPNRSKPR